MEIINMPVDEVIPYINNPRVNDGAVRAVAESIKEFGWQQPIVVDKDGVIIAGHTRLKAAQRLGMDTVPVVVADGLTPDKVSAYRIADNKTADIAEWDEAALMAELEAIEMDMSAFDFDFESEEIEIQPSGPKSSSKSKTASNDVVKCHAKKGDVWQLGKYRVICGDCIEDGDGEDDGE